MKKDNLFISIMAILAALIIAVGIVNHFVSDYVLKREKEFYQAGYDQALEDNEYLDLEREIKKAYYTGFYDGIDEADESGMGVRSSDIEYIIQGILNEASDFASVANPNISLWDAMDVVSIYLDGYDPDGYPLPTKKEFEEAVDVLLRYAMFLEWNTESYSDIFKHYDPFYG
jgi:hypothetical protein